MVLQKIQAMANTVDRLVKDGLHASASRFFSDNVQALVLSPFKLDGGTKFLVHYTSIDVLFSMLSCPVQHGSFFALSSDGPSEESGKDSRFLRMYDTLNSNDPNEARFFLSATPAHHRFTVNHSHLWELLSDQSRLPAYVTSFSALSKPEDADNLIHWRTYGKEGQGCAIVLPVSRFSTATPVLQVQYGKTRVLSTLNHLSEVFDSLASVESLSQLNLDITNPVPRYLSTSLSPIPYLHKASDYEFEKEVRVLVPFADLPLGSLFCHRIHGAEFGTKLRHFSNHDALHIREILQTDSKILIGPAVPSSSNLRFVLKHRLIHLGLGGTNVCTSEIDFRS